MLRASDIRDSLAELIKVKARLPLKVFFNHVNNAADDYCWIKLTASQENEGFGVFQRKIRVTIQIVLVPDSNGEIKHTDLYDIADKLSEVTSNYIQIADRYITIYDTNSRIFDDILIYEFMLDFNDGRDKPTDEEFNELMRELYLETDNMKLHVEEE